MFFWFDVNSVSPVCVRLYVCVSRLYLWLLTSPLDMPSSQLMVVSSVYSICVEAPGFIPLSVRIKYEILSVFRRPVVVAQKVGYFYLDKDCLGGHSGDKTETR